VTRAAVLLFIVCASASLTARPAPQNTPNEWRISHIEWVVARLKAMQSVKVGMRRAELLKVFSEEGGGLSNRTQRTYVDRECPYFKVNREQLTT